MNTVKQINPSNHDFLLRISQVDNPPTKLFYKGSLPNRLPTVAIVGSRKPTSYGREINNQLVTTLVKSGVIIVSGLAIGHDGLAHRSCLEAGGTTVAVLPCGLDQIYPRSNSLLAQNILNNGGALLSEYPSGTNIMKHNFLARNRLISGLADIVVVIEAGEKSGTLNTASHALNQGREVMAVPGNITSPLSKGCNKLIAQGATPVLSANDILDKLNIKLPTDKISSRKIHFDSPESQKIYDLMLDGINDGEVLLQKSGLTIGLFTMSLTMLELNGYIKPLGNNKWGRLE